MPVGAVAGTPGNGGKAHRLLGVIHQRARGQGGIALGGGAMSFITQSRKCTRMALTVWVCGIGLAANTPLPHSVPGHMGGVQPAWC